MMTKTFVAVLLQASLLWMAKVTAETVVGPEELVPSSETKPVDVVKYVDEVENLDEEYGLFERFLQDGVSLTDMPSSAPSEARVLETDSPTIGLTAAPTVGAPVAPTISTVAPSASPTDAPTDSPTFTLLSFSLFSLSMVDASIDFQSFSMILGDMPTATPTAPSTLVPTTELEIPTAEPLSFSLFGTAASGAPTGLTEGPTSMTESPTAVRRIRRFRI